jgi:hypothetical protein
LKSRAIRDTVYNPSSRKPAFFKPFYAGGASATP